MTDTERTTPEVDERLDDRLRYIETVDETGRFSTRRCELRLDGEEDAVSSLVLHSLRVRMGATTLHAEGVGGVQTRPEHQRRGFNDRLIRRALAGAKQRVAAVFLYGIEKYYPRYGFATCLAESSMSVWVRRTKALRLPERWAARAAAADDLPAVIGLFNELHARRPWTLVRDARVIPHLLGRTAWRPRPDIVLYEHDGTVEAYAVIAHHPFGWNGRTFTVLEAGARDLTGAHVVLADLSNRCREADLEQLTIEEPTDSLVGLAARSLGCTVTVTTGPDGGGMGTMLDRLAVVNELAGELERRARERIADQLQSSTSVAGAIDRVVAGLAAGDLVPDDGALLRLLVGYRSWDESVALDEVGSGCESGAQDATCRLFFPGGTTSVLPVPYAHRLDRY